MFGTFGRCLVGLFLTSVARWPRFGLVRWDIRVVDLYCRLVGSRYVSARWFRRRCSMMRTRLMSL